MMRYTATKTVVKGGEAADITGMSLEAQANNRRAGYIPASPEGRIARFDFFELCQLAFMNDAAMLGIGPKRSGRIAEWIGHHATYFAITLPGAIEVHRGIASGAISVGGAAFPAPRGLVRDIARNSPAEIGFKVVIYDDHLGPNGRRERSRCSASR